VAKIVGDHGGIIECESQPRKTIFRVLLPMFNTAKNFEPSQWRRRAGTVVACLTGHQMRNNNARR